MQQTKTYKLNLIEMDDTFSPDPLNQNTQKVEQALSAETAQRASADAALGSRLAVLEGRRLVTGSYTGTGEKTTQTIKLGFDPILLYVCGAYYGSPLGVIAFPNMPVRNNYGNVLKLVPGGFTVAYEFNYSNYIQYYVAVL